MSARPDRTRQFAIDGVTRAHAELVDWLRGRVERLGSDAVPVLGRLGGISADLAAGDVDLAMVVEALADRCAALQRAWAAPPGVGDSCGALPPVSPMSRWREVELARLAIDPGYGVDDLPDMYVRLDLRIAEMQYTSRLPMGLTKLTAEAMQMEPRRRLLWLLDQIEGHDQTAG